MILVGFEPIIKASERPQTHALDREAAVTGTSDVRVLKSKGLTCNIKEITKIHNKFWFENLKRDGQLDNPDIDGDNIKIDF
jgi:hypothetical protein